MQTLRVQPCSGVAPELAWKYAGLFEKVGVPATLLACRHQQHEIRICTDLVRPSLPAFSPKLYIVRLDTLGIQTAQTRASARTRWL